MRSTLPSLWSRRPGNLDLFTSLQQEMNRMFEDFGSPLMREPEGRLLTPRIDVIENEGAVEISAELPGIDEKDVDVSLDENVLTIRGEKRFERKEEKSDFHVSERSWGSFARTIALPFRVEPDQIRADFEKGVLHITVPKPSQGDKGRARIPIGRQAGQQGAGQKQGRTPTPQPEGRQQDGGPEAGAERSKKQGNGGKASSSAAP